MIVTILYLDGEWVLTITDGTNVVLTASDEDMTVLVKMAHQELAKLL